MGKGKVRSYRTRVWRGSQVTILKPQGLHGAEYSVIYNSNDKLEISFMSTKLPLSIDISYILNSCVSGSFAMPSTSFWQDRQLLILLRQGWSSKFGRDKFHYMAITDEKQGIMLMPEDLLPDRGKQLIVPESVLLANPINPDRRDGGVHGWISSGPVIGFWVVFPSHEFGNGGPTKENLTVHTCPPCLDVCSSQPNTSHISITMQHS
ncbi:hypothetical protein NC653_010215 [Populus alba x Populus x berolinensis]|uniref:Uncharacterized protein n=1 Tax=Populus alba x Populus x berolinensis TaxID=444605 RepID=A0AAD6R0C1_9ROSI|nr:hypothetical protein NC653_010215 [Populus alba x Populus x berolinensis]